MTMGIVMALNHCLAAQINDFGLTQHSDFTPPNCVSTRLSTFMATAR